MGTLVRYNKNTTTLGRCNMEDHVLLFSGFLEQLDKDTAQRLLDEMDDRPSLDEVKRQLKLLTSGLAMIIFSVSVV